MSAPYEDASKLRENISKLLDETEQNRLTLLRTDLNLIRTLTDSVESEIKLKSHEHAAQTFTHASKGYADASRIFGQRKCWGEEHTNEIQEKLADLRWELDRLQQLLYPGP